MGLRRWLSGVALPLLALGGLVVSGPVIAQKAPVLVRAAIAGEVVAWHLVEVGQVVKEGDPLVFVRSPTRTDPALAAVAPVDGRVTKVSVRPGSRVDIGDVVAVIQPL